MDYNAQKMRVAKYEVLGLSKNGLEIQETYINTQDYYYYNDYDYDEDDDDDDDDEDYELDDDYGIYTE